MGYLGQRESLLDARILASCGSSELGLCCGGSCALPAGFSNTTPPGGGWKTAYYAGGNAIVGGFGPVSDKTDKLDLLTGIMTALPSGTLVVPVWCLYPLSDGVYTLFSAGALAGGTYSTVVNKIPLATDTNSQSGNTLVGRASGKTVTNREVGYLIGGFTNGLGAVAAEVVSYSVGTFSAVGGTLQTDVAIGVGSYELHDMGATSSLTQGWVMGGKRFGFAERTTVDLVDLATATVSLSSVSSTLPRSYLAGAGNATEGLFMGGIASGSTTPVTLIERLVYATGVLTTVDPLSLGTRDAAAAGDASVAYYAGGSTLVGSVVSVSTAQAVDYATHTPALAAAADLKSGARWSVRAAGASYF